MTSRISLPDADPADFLPALQRVTDRPPSPLGRAVLWTVLALVGGTLLWAALGKLDIVAVAEGKLVPMSYVKIVQPAEQGVVKEILVQEGEQVREGQVLIRMDTALSEAEGKALTSDYETKRITLRRIDAQLAGRPLMRTKEDPPLIYAQAQAQYGANVQAYRNALESCLRRRITTSPRLRRSRPSSRRRCRITASRRKRSRSWRPTASPAA
jgi:hemolysin D